MFIKMEVPQSIWSFRNVAWTLIFSLWLYWLWCRRQCYAFALSFPGKIGLPFFESMLAIGSTNNILTYFGKYLKEFNQTACIWFGMIPTILTNDPEVVEQILTSSEFLAKAMPLYEPIHYSLKNCSIITSPVQQWRAHRKSLNVIFKHKTLLSFFPSYNVAKNRLVKDFDKFAEHGEHPVLETILRNLIVVIAETSMDIRNGYEDKRSQELVRLVLAYFKSIASQIVVTGLYLHKLLQQWPEHRKILKSAFKLLDEELKDIVREKEHAISENPDYFNYEKPVNFIDQAYKLYKEKQFSWNDILTEGYSVMAAATETTSNTIYAALVYLAMHPPIQERVFQEIATFYPDKNADVEYEHFTQLPYLERFIHETLRLAPGITIIGRQITTPFKLPNGKIVPTGFQLIISIVHLHRNQNFWGPNADKFDPDNFLPEKIASRHPFAYIPFSKGARNCIGWQQAQISLRIMLIALIRNFRFETDFEYEDFQLKFHISSAWKNYPNLRIYRRP